jgi:enoyl-[acyl-carrier-protein] reductase (NADH)
MSVPLLDIKADRAKDDDWDQVIAVNLTGRAGQPKDIAGAVAYLCSEDASFVTGQLIDVNGGADF